MAAPAAHRIDTEREIAPRKTGTRRGYRRGHRIGTAKSQLQSMLRQSATWRGISPRARSVFLQLWGYAGSPEADENGMVFLADCFPGIEQLAFDEGCTRRTIERALGKLKAAGLVDWAEDPGRTNLYTLFVPPELMQELPDAADQAAPDPPRVSHPERRQCRTRSGVNVAGGATLVTHNHNQVSEPKTTTTDQEAAAPPPAGGGGGKSLDGERSERVELLRAAGVRLAPDLADQHGADRIRQVIAAADNQGMGAGWIVRTLQEDHPVSDPKPPPRDTFAERHRQVELVQRYGELDRAERKRVVVELRDRLHPNVWRQIREALEHGTSMIDLLHRQDVGVGHVLRRTMTEVMDASQVHTVALTPPSTTQKQSRPPSPGAALRSKGVLIRPGYRHGHRRQTQRQSCSQQAVQRQQSAAIR